MTKINEQYIYNKSHVNNNSGEIEEWDDIIFPFVIRKLLMNKIRTEIKGKNPQLILDYGCGGGWLSNLLSKKNYSMVGIDISIKILEKGKLSNSKTHFLSCDVEKLPFRDDCFDYIIGISILHHILNLNASVKEIYRILNPDGGYLFEEPNLFNPLSAIGRKLFPLETHTLGEKPLIVSQLNNVFYKNNFNYNNNFLFLFSFPLSRMFKLLNIHIDIRIANIIYYLEVILSKLPLVKYINASFIIMGKKER